MQDALYGLLGGLGGAAIAAGAAYWGPVKAQKEALREAERQRELAQAQAEAVRADERRMARLARVALIRRRIGDWMHLLMFNMHSGSRRVDAESFATAALAARNAVSEAIYDGVSEGFLIVATEASQRGFQESQIRIGEEEQTGLGAQEVGADALAEGFAAFGMFGLTVEDWAQTLGAAERGEGPPVDWALLQQNADTVALVLRASDEELVRAREVLAGLRGFYGLYVLHGLLLPDTPAQAALRQRIDDLGMFPVLDHVIAINPSQAVSRVPGGLPRAVLRRAVPDPDGPARREPGPLQHPRRRHQSGRLRRDLDADRTQAAGRRRSVSGAQAAEARAWRGWRPDLVRGAARPHGVVSSWAGAPPVLQAFALPWTLRAPSGRPGGSGHQVTPRCIRKNRHGTHEPLIGAACFRVWASAGVR
ncbi:hypothetical protein ABT202_25965 [Streptomyces sp900105245]|uniref:hypothetical protein n=1 Tax=Streptomyces sp. 900105245 TaxID=3154379 RepID=UPI00331CCC6B